MTSLPALLGGAPLRPAGQPVENTIGEAEKAAVLRVLDRGELSGFVGSATPHFWGGEEVQGLERAFKEHFGVKHAIAVNSATSGLHCAVSATGVGPGDEVIVSPYTMSASATAILMTGAIPVFADIEDETFGLDPASVEANITPYTRGIMAVNIFGHPARLGELRAIADRHKLFLIEDNAQSPDANYKGRKAGTIGDLGVFSFNRHKTMQSGEGGVVVTNDDKLALKAALMRNHGEVVVADMGVTDIVNTVGLNLRMSEMEAAVARVQFARLPSFNNQRIRNAERISHGLKGTPGLIPPVVAEGCSHVYYMYPLRYDEAQTGMSRELFCKAMMAEGFYARGGYVKPIYLEPLYQQKICFGPNGFPFSASPRSKQLSYQRGICPTVERLQDQEIIISTAFRPPATERDADLFVAACQRILAARDALVRADVSGVLPG